MLSKDAFSPSIQRCLGVTIILLPDCILKDSYPNVLGCVTQTIRNHAQSFICSKIIEKKKSGKHKGYCVKPTSSTVFLTGVFLCLNILPVVTSTEHISIKETAAFLLFYG